MKTQNCLPAHRDCAATTGLQLLDHVQEEAASVLGLATSALDPSHNLFELGLDSLAAIELRNRLQRRLQLDLPQAVVAEHRSVAAIAGFISGQVCAAEALGESSARAPVRVPMDESLGPLAIARRVQPELERLSRSRDFELYDFLVPQLEVLSSTYAVHALRELGWSMHAGDCVRLESLASRLRVAERHQRLLQRILEMLGEDGVLRKIGAEWEVTRSPTPADPQAESARLLSQYPVAQAELWLLNRCGSRLAELLRGHIDPLRLLLTGEALTIIETLYQKSPPLRVLNDLARAAVTAFLSGMPADHRVTVLEVGAGTGGTTANLLPLFNPVHTEYTFSDKSPWFLSRAASRFQAFPFLQYRLLDVERPPDAQGFPRHSFDVVVASHVLHATRNLRATLGHIRELLAPNGLLVAAELTHPQRWLDVVFGVTEGWWQFEDRDVRPSYPLASLEQWLDLLGSANGFCQATSIPAIHDAERYLAGRGALLLTCSAPQRCH